MCDDSFKEELKDEFIVAIKKAAPGVNQDYFKIEFCDPCDDNVLKYRERVFCYELYHQLRCNLRDDYPYKFHGEMDKRAHHEFNKIPALKSSIPDFIVHEPGKMNNLIVMEVKHCNSDFEKVKGDIDKLHKFQELIKYTYGILYVFGTLSKENEETLITSLRNNQYLVLHRYQKDFEIFPKK